MSDRSFTPIDYELWSILAMVVAGATDKEIKGAWVIHHGRKLVLDVNGPAEFPAINEAAKAATLLTKLGQTNQATYYGYSDR